MFSLKRPATIWETFIFDLTIHTHAHTWRGREKEIRRERKVRGSERGSERVWGGERERQGMGRRGG